MKLIPMYKVTFHHFLFRNITFASLMCTLVYIRKTLSPNCFVMIIEVHTYLKCTNSNQEINFLFVSYSCEFVWETEFSQRVRTSLPVEENEQDENGWEACWALEVLVGITNTESPHWAQSVFKAHVELKSYHQHLLACSR